MTSRVTGDVSVCSYDQLVSPERDCAAWPFLGPQTHDDRGDCCSRAVT